IDSDGHLHEPFDLFERYMEKEFYPLRPRIVDLRGDPRDQGRWIIEGRVVPRMPFSRGVGAGGFKYVGPRHPRMRARNDSLDDVRGRLQDLDQLGIDVQVVYPTALAWIADVENKELAAACCRAYNNYVAERSAEAPDRLKGVALVPLQDPPAAAEEAVRAVRELKMVGVTIPGMVGNRPLSSPEFLPFFKAVNDLDTALGFHAVTGMHYTPWADCFHDFFSTHTTCMPFSMMVAMVSVLRLNLFEQIPNLRCAFLEIGASWLPYWSWWVGKHLEEGDPGLDTRAGEEWGDAPYRLPASREPAHYIAASRILTGFEQEEDLRLIIDQIGAQALMYASDYPHGDMDWERVHAVKALKGLAESEKAALLGDNARRFYKL
ncbi:MAG: amidohydrolase, partial [Deltaproteobacteria bacterium]|nr:amidohydrolase [Deltaproteobacteria bacterium]